MKVFWCFVLMVFAVPCFAQREAENWYFGFIAGLSFKDGDPQAINGRLFTLEGSATISDTAGNLLFYTDGRTIWNAKHEPMPYGLELIGGDHNNVGTSSAQGCLIIPDPSNQSQYFVFVAPDFSTLPYPTPVRTDKLCYYKVDMEKNDGLGDVLGSINNNPVKETRLGSASERLTGTVDCFGTGFWVVTHHNERNEFYSYHVTKSGIDTNAVVSVVGSVYPLSLHYKGFEYQQGYSVSCSKISPNGKLLASPNPTNNNVELFDFNNRTGQVENPRVIITDFQAYGVTFSPDNSKLYVSGYDTLKNLHQIVQFTVSDTNAAKIYNSRRIIHESLTSRKYTLQLAPNGKVYIANGKDARLSSIEKPNEYSVDYKDTAVISLNDSFYPVFGLPNFIDNLFNEGESPLSCKSYFLSDTICEGGLASFKDTAATALVSSWHWEFPGGVPMTSTEQSPKDIYYEKRGVYPVRLIRFGSYWGADTVFNTINVSAPPKADAGADVAVCLAGSARLGTPAIAGNTYSWTPTDGLDNPNIAQPTVTSVFDGKKYFLKVTNEFGCEAIDSVIVSMGEIKAIVSDTSVCRGSSVVLKAEGGSEYEWSTSDWLSATTGASVTASPLEDITYQVIAKSGECRDTAFLKVTVLDAPTANAGSDKEICFGESVELGVVSSEPGLRYAWTPTEGLLKTDVSNPIATVLKTTEYIVEVTNEAGCVARDTVLVTVSNLLKLTATADTSVCAGGSVQLSAVSDEGVIVKWTPETGLDNPNIANPIAKPTETTTYTVLAFKNGGLCSAVDSVRIEVLKLPEVTAKDITLCEGESGELWAESDEPVVSWSWTPATGLSNPNIQNPIVTAFKSEIYTVTATNKSGCTAFKTLSVTVTEKETVTAVLKADKAELEPGESTNVQFLLKAENSAGITSFKVLVHFDVNVFQFTKNSGKFLNGVDNTWFLKAEITVPGEIEITANGQTPIANNELAFELTAYLAKQTSEDILLKLTEINGEVLKEEEMCRTIATESTKLVLKEVCAGDMRLVNVGEFQTALQQITPNPVTNETIEINYSVGIEGVISLEIYNSQGELLKTIFKGNQKTGVFKEMISTEAIPAGVFLVKLSTLQVTQTQMFTIVK